MKTVAIIQARMDSQRLPGKALMRIGDRRVLDWVIHRTKQVWGVDEIVVATTNRPEDDWIKWAAEDLHDVSCYRGDAFDVLHRVTLCAREHGADQVLRVTADCPLLDPGVNGNILWMLGCGSGTYVSMETRSNGFVQEAFTVGALERAWRLARVGPEREHVIPWMLKNERVFMLPDSGLGSDRWCVDTLEDLDRLRGLYELEPRLFDLPARDLVGLVVPA